MPSVDVQEQVDVQKLFDALYKRSGEQVVVREKATDDETGTELLLAYTLENAIQTLEPKLQQVIRLRYGEQKTWRVIAVQIGKTENTARSWHNQALARLRNINLKLGLFRSVIGPISI